MCVSSVVARIRCGEWAVEMWTARRTTRADDDDDVVFA